MRFRYSCGDNHNEKELAYILGRSRPVTHDTFKRHIGHVAYKERMLALGYTGHQFELKNDKNVTYHKSKTPYGKIVYVIQHDSTKYVYY